MLRSVVLGVSERAAIRKAVTGGLGRRVALRFVAGEHLDDALRVTRSLAEEGLDVSLDHLGENVDDAERARNATAVYVEALSRIGAEGLRANVSVKLTQLGLDVDEGLARTHALEIVRAAEAAGTTVTLDMEDHRYTSRTIETCIAISDAAPGRIGVAIQAYLHRTPEDLARLAERPVAIRLCKGAYKEPREVAFTDRGDVDAAFARLAVQLLRSSAYPMIATHDDRLIEHVCRQVEILGRERDSLEFQLLYGVRRELQRRLVRDGYRVRIYVPFGAEWYPYLTRRIAERPANLRFFAEALLRG